MPLETPVTDDEAAVDRGKAGDTRAEMAACATSTRAVAVVALARIWQSSDVAIGAVGSGDLLRGEIMKLNGSAAIVAVCGAVLGAAVSLAAPASAELLDGTYQETTAETGASSTAVFTSCGPGCKHVEYPGSRYLPADFHLTGTTWTRPIPQYNGVETIDDVTLADVSTTQFGGNTNVFHSQFTKVD